MDRTLRLHQYIAISLLAGLLAVLTAGCAHIFDRTLPIRDRAIALNGLDHPVKVSFDRLGIPHISARSFEDALFAQGYVTAQDRLFFMDLLRRLVKGELAEIIGKTALPVDRFMRTVGLARVAGEEARHLDAETKARLEAYTAGVNAYITSLDGPRHFGFSFLFYDPEPWTVEDSLALGKGMSWQLDRMWLADLMRARLRETLGDDMAADLLLEAGPTNRPICGTPGASAVASPVLPPIDPVVSEALTDAGSMELPGALVRLLPALRTGSNNWVVSGSRTATGKPILANDPHLQHFMISMVYLCHLKVEAEGIDVIGGSFPGMPGIPIGHNGSIAWGFTTTWADSDDIFVEQFNPEDPSQYKVGDGWVGVEEFTDRIAVRWSRDVDHNSTWTRHGPVIRRSGDTGLALKWTSHAPPDNMARSFLGVSLAKNWDEFLDAFRDYKGGCFNAVYADAEGNIGYHLIGAVPVRASGDGSVPVAGPDSEHDWTGTIPFDELPHVLNPSSGWLATSNNRIIGPDYPNLITTCWEASYRQGRVAELLAAKEGFVVEDFQAIQADRFSRPGRSLRDGLIAASAKIEPVDPDLVEALGRLEDWDCLMTADSQAASIAYETLEVLTKRLLEPHLGPELFGEYRSTWPCLYHSVEMIVEGRIARWLPGAYGSYDELLLDSLAEALAILKNRFGTAKQERWAWGGIHALRFPWPVNKLFGTGKAIPLGGDDFTVNVAHPSESPDVLLLSRSMTGDPGKVGSFMPDPDSLDVAAGPCLRMIVDFDDLERSVYIVDRGQSEHPRSPHNKDQLDMWLDMQYYTMMTSPERIGAERTAHLHLVPAPAAE
ncbi:penicillin acylase family protein [Thermodesulfobacteriota bacterium]